MTVLAQVNERNFPAQANDFPFSLPGGATRVVVTLDHPDWPDGPCARVRVEWADGSGITADFGGGPKVDVFGNPRTGNGVTIWTVTPPAGVTAGTAHIDMLQALRTAILVEAL